MLATAADGENFALLTSSNNVEAGGWDKITVIYYGSDLYTGRFSKLVNQCHSERSEESCSSF